MIRLYAVLAILCACKGEEAREAKIEPLIEQPRVTMPNAVETAKEPPLKPTVADLVDGGRHWQLTTPHGNVHVWTPKGYKPKGAETIVYVHGFYVHVDQAWTDYHLPTQFAAAAINAVFIACEAPAGMDEAVSWDSLAGLLDTVEKGIAEKLPRRRIVAIGHSGAYRTLLGWLDEKELDTVVLLDAAYGDIDKYQAWVNAAPKHRLIDIGDDTRAWTDQLHAALPTSVVLDGFPSVDEGIPKDAAKAKVLYIKSTLGHFPLVTGGIAIPMILQTLRARKLLDVPLAELIASE